MPVRFQRLLFVTGKGGTGKTTVSAALARYRVSIGNRVLIVSSGESERISSLFGCAPLSSDVTEIEPRISAVHVDPERAWQDYAALILHSRALQTAVFGNRYTKQFLRGIPGLSEWAVLGKAWYHTTETDASGKRRYDVVIVDAPATGHGLEMLRVPKVIVDLAAPGVLRRDAERAIASLADPRHSGIVVVTLAEEMPVLETRELLTELQTELELPVALLVQNRIKQLLFDESERSELVGLGPLEGQSPAEQAVDASRLAALGERAQIRCQAELNGLGLPSRELPFVSLIDSAALDGLASAFRHG